MQAPKRPETEDHLALRVGDKFEAIAKGRFAVVAVLATAVLTACIFAAVGHLPWQ